MVFVSPTDGLNELKDTKRLSVNEICIRLETLVGTKQIIVAKLLHGVAAEFELYWRYSLIHIKFLKMCHLKIKFMENPRPPISSKYSNSGKAGEQFPAHLPLSLSRSTRKVSTLFRETQSSEKLSSVIISKYQRSLKLPAARQWGPFCTSISILGEWPV